MGPVTECYRCDRAPCSTWNGMAVCGDCLDYYREGAAPFPDESAGSESIASGGSDRHDENSAPAAGSREAATDPPTGLTNPTPDASSSPVPVPVVNEEAREQVFALLEQLPGGESRWDVACRIVALPEIKAAFEARAKLAELQAAPSGSKDLELAEAQAKLEAERAEVDRLREALFGLLVFARGNPVVLAKIHGALDGRVEDGGEL